MGIDLELQVDQLVLLLLQFQLIGLYLQILAVGLLDIGELPGMGEFLNPVLDIAVQDLLHGGGDLPHGHQEPFLDGDQEHRDECRQQGRHEQEGLRPEGDPAAHGALGKIEPQLHGNHGESLLHHGKPAPVPKSLPAQSHLPVPFQHQRQHISLAQPHVELLPQPVQTDQESDLQVSVPIAADQVLPLPALHHAGLQVRLVQRNPGLQIFLGIDGYLVLSLRHIDIFIVGNVDIEAGHQREVAHQIGQLVIQPDSGLLIPGIRGLPPQRGVGIVLVQQ